MFTRQLYASLASLLLLAVIQSGEAKSFLDNSSLKTNPVQKVLEHKPATVASCEQVVSVLARILLGPSFLHESWADQLTGPIEATRCDYETVERYNDDLFHELHKLVETPFFKYFRVRYCLTSIRFQ